MYFYFSEQVLCFASQANFIAVSQTVAEESSVHSICRLGLHLPLVAHWNTGSRQGGVSPQFQLKLIEEGHHILPWFKLNDPGKLTLPSQYEKAIKYVAERGLPISIIGSQWEKLLTSQNAYLGLPVVRNPNVVLTDGRIEKAVSPFGPLDPWREVGELWTSQPVLKKVQEWYPNPPLVLFVSNNEHTKLRWHEVEKSHRYIQMYGSGRSDEFKRKIVGDGWIERYGALFDGMRDGLSAPAWKANSRFVGYNAFFPDAFGRWSGWQAYSLHIKDRNEPWSSVWDGASVPFYTHNWDPSVDFTAWSPQIRAMNQVFVLEEIYKKNPNYWFELSVWDGNEQSKDNDKRKYYASRGQDYTPERYAGMVQFGMWLLRPRVVREFRGWTDTVANNGDYFMALVRAVDRVHEDETLKRFWRHGRLLDNPSTPHLHQSAIPEELKNQKRWFLLDTNLDPRKPWTLETEIPVFSLALELGRKPEREWLIYAFAPLVNEREVTVQIPGERSARITAGEAGHFYLVRENIAVPSRIQ
jgi:hypothetical protein